MNNFSVSIIVPCYNQAQYLSETLDSVLAQTYFNWECIIVNDGSPDNTEEVAKLYCEKDIRFKYLFKINGGLSSARNAGIKASSGEFILPLDSDDLIGSTYLEKAIDRFRKYAETKLVYCKAELFGEMTGEWKLPDYNYNSILFENMIFCSAVFKRKDFNETIGYNENMVQGFEDWDFWLSLLNKSDVVFQIPEICFFYRKKENSMTQCITKEDGAALNKQLVLNHREKYEKFLPEIIGLKFHENQQKEIIINLSNELINIRSSKAYRLGKYLLKPFSFIRNNVR